MTEFLQLHGLVAYPASNLNRDDLGRPKTVTIGRSTRLRVSSQSLKRAWRMSEQFVNAFDGEIGVRTKDMGTKIYCSLIGGISLQDTLSGEEISTRTEIGTKAAKSLAEGLIKNYGEIETGKGDEVSIKTKQLVHYSNLDIERLDNVMARAANGEDIDPKDEIPTCEGRTSIDISMFGRMIADNPGLNCEAAVQVAHAHTVHSVTIEDDYFTAVDDLNDGSKSAGSAHIGETGFGAGLFYMYVCIDRDLLIENLGGSRELADRAVSALVQTMATVTPTGKQNSFASRAYASYILAERGTQQPRSLSVAFLKPLDRSQDLLPDAIAVLRDTRGRLEEAYGSCCQDSAEMDTINGGSSIDGIIDILTG